MNDQKNMIIAAALSFVVIVVWSMFFMPTPEPGAPVATETAAAPSASPSTAGTAPGGDEAGATAETAAVGSVMIETPSITGTFTLKGGRLDNTHLVNYRETLARDSDTVIQLAPVGTSHPYFAAYGWLAGDTGAKTPNPNTIWAVESGDKLTPASPVTLVWENGEGLVFRRKISVDDQYMFTISQSVQNTGAEAVSLSPYGYIARRNQPDTTNFFILHEGAVGVFDGKLNELSYDDMMELPGDGRGSNLEQTAVASDGFLGFTDKYWMTAIAPGPGVAFTGVYKFTQRATGPEYRTEALMPAQEVGPGATAEVTTYLFSGAKEYAAISGYEEKLKIVGFIDSIDWGWFFFLTKPIFQLLLWVKSIIGNMGFSIIVLTLIIKAALFPLAYKSYVSMSKMKKLQPEMEKIKERVGDDRAKLQQEMMALYKKEKANPAAGCLPILLQIPIFFSLYKVLFVTIEMRHAPFILWVKDLSAPDPTSILNLFGLLPWQAPAHDGSILGLISIGVFPILMGVTMWMQQKLNPAPTDAMQAKIFAWMPWIFMFMLGRFAVGLVIYWCANNILTFTQQYLIMRSQGVDVDFFGNVKKTFRRKKTKEG